MNVSYKRGLIRYRLENYHTLNPRVQLIRLLHQYKYRNFIWWYKWWFQRAHQPHDTNIKFLRSYALFLFPFEPKSVRFIKFLNFDSVSHSMWMFAIDESVMLQCMDLNKKYGNCIYETRYQRRIKYSHFIKLLWWYQAIKLSLFVFLHFNHWKVIYDEG